MQLRDVSINLVHCRTIYVLSLSDAVRKADFQQLMSSGIINHSQPRTKMVLPVASCNIGRLGARATERCCFDEYDSYRISAFLGWNESLSMTFVCVSRIAT
jgi:hypothetical protein